MLHLVRDKTRTPPEGWPAWPRAPHDDGFVDPRSEPRIDPRDVTDLHYDDEPPRSPRDRDRARQRPKRGPGFGAFVLTFLFALILGAIVGGGVLAWRGGMLDDIMASLMGENPPVSAASSQVASAAGSPEVAPAPAPAPQSPPQQGSAPSQAQLPPVPDVPTVMMLIRTTLSALHTANLSGNYSVLRDLAAPAFQEANTGASLAAAFGKLAGRDVDLSQILVLSPTLMREPAIDPEGRLRILGFFPASGAQVNFEMIFQMVGNRWKLFGIGADAAPLPADAPPPPPRPVAGKIPDGVTLVALVRTAILTLNQANITGNYAVLVDSGAPGFRQANTVAKLGEAFTAMRERGLDLSPVSVIEPKLFRPPALDGKGYLRLTGFFPSQPEQVNFDLAFAFADGAWRLFGIGVNTSQEVAAPPGSGPQANAPAAPQENAGAPAADQMNADRGANAPRPVATAPVPRLRPQHTN